jgi:hypothetical protein
MITREVASLPFNSKLICMYMLSSFEENVDVQMKMQTCNTHTCVCVHSALHRRFLFLFLFLCNTLHVCLCHEFVCVFVVLTFHSVNGQAFSTPARAFWRQQLEKFLEWDCKYEIEALNAVNHSGSDPLGFDF